MTTEQKWREIIEKGCEYEWHPQQDIYSLLEMEEIND